MNTGHPRHQVRDFRIIVKHPRHGRSTITSPAQTEHDALLRLGIALGNTYPGTNPAEWITLGIDDPAPFTWMPGDSDAMTEAPGSYAGDTIGHGPGQHVGRAPRCPGPVPGSAPGKCHVDSRGQTTNGRRIMSDTTTTPTRPIMTRAELAAHKVTQYGRDYRESGDGYEDMEAEEGRGWRVIASWGRDGWNLGDWPYVMIYVRDINPGSMTDGKLDRVYELMQIVEGDRDVHAFTSQADRSAAIDYLFLWYAAGSRWAPLTYEDRERLDAGELTVDEKFRGPCMI